MRSTRTLNWLAIAAIAFGILTVASGGRALFGNVEVRTGLGNIVPFVLWFNFVAGFVYVLAGVALLRAKRWATPLAFGIAVSTVLVYLAFIAHIVVGGRSRRVLSAPCRSVPCSGSPSR
jgi:hypothetical protein